MTIGIHKEGRSIIFWTIIFMLIITFPVAYFTPSGSMIPYATAVVFLFVLVFVIRFFRKSNPQAGTDKNAVYAPADGHIVAIEETMEGEFFNEKKLMISVFMSVWNVHINWYPVDGKVLYFRHHPGKFLLARHPKSSILNERTSLALETPGGKGLLLRQIAGAVARRIRTYAVEGAEIKAGQEMGFIKFGSRVDVFLPVGSIPEVQIGQKVKGCITKLALLKNP